GRLVRRPPDRADLEALRTPRRRALRVRDGVSESAALVAELAVLLHDGVPDRAARAVRLPVELAVVELLVTTVARKPADRVAVRVPQLAVFVPDGLVSARRGVAHHVRLPARLPVQLAVLELLVAAAPDQAAVGARRRVAVLAVLVAELLVALHA